MSKVCYFHDGVSEHRFDESSFPVTIGAVDADIKLPGSSSVDGLAYIDFSEGRAFIQPDEYCRIALNDHKLYQSSWLHDQDIITIGSSHLNCHIDQWMIRLDLLKTTAQKKPVLQPPTEPRPEPALGDSFRSKIASDSVADQPSQKDKSLSLKSSLLAAIFILLLLLVGFVFSAVPVMFNVSPEPDNIDLEGAIPGLELGRHFLVWPGKYRVNVEKAGYMTLHKEVEISHDGADSFAYKMEKLGGLLAFSSIPIDGAEVFIDGQSVGETPLQNIQVSPGTHNIVFKLKRYQDDIQELEVAGEGKQQNVVGRLLPNWADVNISSVPDAAIIKVDGEVVGETPAILALQAGEHQLQIEKAGFDAWRRHIQVTAGQDSQLPRVTLQKQSGIVELITAPADVRVIIDGKYRGESPLILKLRPDLEYRLKLIKPGYAQLSKVLIAASGERQTIQLQLARQYGEIDLQDFPAGAKLYIDGKLQTFTKNPLMLTTRSHKLEVRKPGYQTFSTHITPRKGSLQPLSVSLAPEIKTVPVKKALTAAEKSALIYVQPGRFTMGASRREQGRRSNEVMHEVELNRPFYIGKKEVSNAEYRNYQADHHSGSARGLSLDGKNHPVVNVSWADAAGYCNWLSKRYGLTPVYIEKGGVMVAPQPLSNGYRLPTEAEWVWVARFAGQTSALKFPWGTAYPPTADSGNYARGDRFSVTAPVASFKPTRLGLYDIGGNAAEWVHDYYSVIPALATQVSKNPLGPKKGKHHVVRGSSWKQYGISELRLSYRDYTNSKRPDLGFRVARYAD